MSGLNIFISAGDPSGEKHAARLLRELRSLAPELRANGLGGPALEAAGACLLCPQDRLAVMGLVEVLGHLGFFLRLLKEIKRHLINDRPDLLVLVDFPDFNLRLARIARRLGIPVLYYISPQVWAWRTRRKKAIARLADRLAVVFPFEVEFYRGEALEVEFVGHPLVGELTAGSSREDFLRRHALDPARPLVGLMPGSRAQEIARHLGLFLEAVRLMAAQRPALQFALGCLPHTAAALTESQLQELDGLGVRRVLDDSPGLIAHSRVLLTKSGTTTMEAAVLGTPMVIVYRTSALTHFLARRLVRVSHIGMPNLLAADPAIPELIQGSARPALLAGLALDLCEESSPRRRRILAQLEEVRRKLTTGKGASRRVAEIVLEMCGREGRRS